ncbi:hypothetical protein N8315_10520, partial [Octadecabacter sp.]|nr:hypothetical protein [Octadecabacter sp.]
DGFQATGNLNLRRARITGNLEIIKAEINGLVDLQSGRVDEGFFWKNISGDVTTLDLTDTSVGVLRDDLESWDAVKRSRLKGFRYDGIDSDIRVRYRLEHLAPTKDQVATFDPQPHTQLVKTLSTHGQPVGAARVRFYREKHLRAAIYARVVRETGTASWKIWTQTFWTREFAEIAYGLSSLFRWVFGYGHLPALVLWFVGGLWLFSVLLYSGVFLSGQMAPNSAVVLTSAEWLEAVAGGLCGCRLENGRMECAGACGRQCALYL